MSRALVAYKRVAYKKKSVYLKLGWSLDYDQKKNRDQIDLHDSAE